MMMKKCPEEKQVVIVVVVLSKHVGHEARKGKMCRMVGLSLSLITRRAARLRGCDRMASLTIPPPPPPPPDVQAASPQTPSPPEAAAAQADTLTWGAMRLLGHRRLHSLDDDAFL